MRQAFQHAVSCLPLHFSVQTEDAAGEDAAGGTLQVQTHQSLPYSFSHLTLSLVTVIHLAIWLELISLYILPHTPLSLLPQAAECRHPQQIAGKSMLSAGLPGLRAQDCCS